MTARERLDAACRRLVLWQLPLLAAMVLALALPFEEGGRLLFREIGHRGWVLGLALAPLASTLALPVGIGARVAGRSRAALAVVVLPLVGAWAAGAAVTAFLAWIGVGDHDRTALAAAALGAGPVVVGALGFFASIAGSWARWAALSLAWWGGAAASIPTAVVLEQLLKGRYERTSVGGALWMGSLAAWVLLAIVLLGPALARLAWELVRADDGP